VKTRPPTLGEASRMQQEIPALLSSEAAANPALPAPITMTSKGCDTSQVYHSFAVPDPNKLRFSSFPR